MFEAHVGTDANTNPNVNVKVTLLLHALSSLQGTSSGRRQPDDPGGEAERRRKVSVRRPEHRGNEGDRSSHVDCPQ